MRYLFSKNNPLNVHDLQIDFQHEKDIIIKGHSWDGGSVAIWLPTDGSYVKDISRKTKNDTLYLRGYWQDDKTFTIVFEKSMRETICFTFEGNEVTISSRDRGKIVFDNLVGEQETIM